MNELLYFAGEGLVGLLVSLLILGLICSLVWWIVGLIPMPGIVKNIVLAVLGIVLLIYLIQYFFGEGSVRL